MRSACWRFAERGSSSDGADEPQPPAGARFACRTLFGQRDRRVRPMWHHVDVVDLGDQLGGRIRLGLSHHLGEFGVIGPRLQPLVPLLLRRIAANVNERVLCADAKLRVAFLRNPVTHIGDSMPCEDRRRPARETLRQRIPLSRQCRVDAQLVEPGCPALLRVAPSDSGRAESYAESRRNFPFQHTILPHEIALRNEFLSPPSAIGRPWSLTRGSVFIRIDTAKTMMRWSGRPRGSDRPGTAIGVRSSPLGFSPVNGAPYQGPVFAVPVAPSGAKRHSLRADDWLHRLAVAVLKVA